MRRPLSPEMSWRRGVILMVVLALLALFAIVGLTFVLYAQSNHRSSTIFRDAWQVYLRGGSDGGSGGAYVPPDIPPAELFRWGLGQIIYDVDDGPGGVQS